MAFTSLAVPPRIGGTVREICTRWRQLGMSIMAVGPSPELAVRLAAPGLRRPFSQTFNEDEKKKGRQGALFHRA